MQTLLRTLAFACLSTLALPSAAAGPACPELLQDSYRPLAGSGGGPLCERHAGQVLLIVNTASKCGFTPQYEGLERLHQAYGDRGFAVLGFPSNDFREQEPGSEQEILEFCTLTYGVQFPMYEKVQVTGDAATPLYRRLREATGEAPGWNFHKYLVDRQGRVVASYGSRTEPGDPALVARIEALLGQPVPPPAAARP